MKEIVFLVEDDPEGGYVAKSFGYPIFTQGDTREELRENIKDALDCHFEDSRERTSVIRLHYIQEETLEYA